MAFSWTKEYLKQGAIAFDNAQTRNIRRIANKYEQDYKYYFLMLYDNLKSSKGNKKIAESARSAAEMSQKIAHQLRTVTGEIPGSLDQQQLLSLENNMAQLTQFFRDANDKLQTNDAFQKQIERLGSTHGLSLDEFKKGHTALMGITAKMRAQGSPGLMSKIAQSMPSDVKDFGSSVRESISNIAFGPFSNIANLGIGGLTGIYKGVKGFISERKARASAKAVARQGNLTGDEYLDTLRDFRSVDDRQLRHSLFDKSRSRPDHTRFAEREYSKFKLFDRPNARSEQRLFSADSKSEGLFYFFDRDAYKAKWTAEVLDVLKKIASKKTENLQKSSTIIAPIAGLAAAAIASIVASQVVAFLKLKDKIGSIASAAVASGPGAALSMLAGNKDNVKNFSKSAAIAGPMSGSSTIAKVIENRLERMFFKPSAVSESVIKDDDTQVSTKLTSVENAKNKSVSIKAQPIISSDRIMLNEMRKISESFRITSQDIKKALESETKNSKKMLEGISSAQRDIYTTGNTLVERLNRRGYEEEN